MSPFPKSSRLLKSRDFRRKVASKRAFKYFVVEFVPSSTSRLGLIVSRRFGKAVERNRFKRLIREAFRLSPKPEGHDLLIRPRKEALTASLSDILQEWTLIHS